MLIHNHNIILDLLILFLINEQVEPNLSVRHLLPAFVTPKRHSPSTPGSLIDSSTISQVLPFQALPSNDDGTLTIATEPLEELQESFHYPQQQQQQQDDDSILDQQDPWSADNIQKCARLWDMTPQETQTLQSLQHKLADVHHKTNTPYELARFIKAFPGRRQDDDTTTNVVETKFRQTVAWRQDNHIDTLLDNYDAPSLYRYFPAAVLKGTDRDGDPIHVERTGVADSSGLLQRYGRDAMVQYSIWLREVQSHGAWHKEYQRQYGHPVKQFTVVMDMHGLTTRNMSPSLLSVGHDVSRIVQDYYAGYAKRVIFIRPPAIFRFAWNTFKPFIDDNMKDRIVFVSDPKQYCQALSEYLDPAVLPREICPEEGRGEAIDEFDTVWTGGKIPEQEEERPRRRRRRAKQMSSSSTSTTASTTGATTTSTTSTPANVDEAAAKKPAFVPPPSPQVVPLTSAVNTRKIPATAIHSSAAATPVPRPLAVVQQPTRTNCVTAKKRGARRFRRIRKILSWPFHPRQRHEQGEPMVEYCI